MYVTGYAGWHFPLCDGASIKKRTISIGAPEINVATDSGGAHGKIIP
jgi:hypothetical protein